MFIFYYIFFSFKLSPVLSLYVDFYAFMVWCKISINITDYYFFLIKKFITIS